jgi:hypothetical protein
MATPVERQHTTRDYIYLHYGVGLSEQEVQGVYEKLGADLYQTNSDRRKEFEKVLHYFVDGKLVSHAELKARGDPIPKVPILYPSAKEAAAAAEAAIVEAMKAEKKNAKNGENEEVEDDEDEEDDEEDGDDGNCHFDRREKINEKLKTTYPFVTLAEWPCCYYFSNPKEGHPVAVLGICVKEIEMWKYTEMPESPVDQAWKEQLEQALEALKLNDKKCKFYFVPDDCSFCT